MKKYLFLLVVATITYSCKQSGSSIVSNEESPQVQVIDYPDDLDKVFDNHGSIEKWKSMKAMSYEIVKEGGNEAQFIDLNDRRERVKSSTFESGFDGKNYWVLADSSYKANTKFYTGLNFYFYSMPFVLADEGINYTKTDPLTFEEIDYPGYKITYDSGIGMSSKDEYFIHYDSNTYEMAWLGYTVTFYSGEPSEKISWIRYNDWSQKNGLKLPNILTWYKTENGTITEPRKKREFANVVVSNQKFEDEKLAMPEGAKIVD